MKREPTPKDSPTLTGRTGRRRGGARIPSYYVDAERKGYSGVAVYSRREPDAMITGLGWPVLDTEGHYLELRFDRLSVASLYLPSGSSGEIRRARLFAGMS